MRLETSRDGFVWIGGRKIGKLCNLAWNGDKSCRLAADLAILIDYLFRTVECVQEGRFDRRYSRCAAKNAGMVDLYLGRVFRGEP